MNFRPFVTISHHDWTIEQTWNEKSVQFDRVAVKGSRRVEQGDMTYSGFLRLLDGLDGRTPAPVLNRPPVPPPPAPPTSEPAPDAPSHPSLFGDAL